MKQLEPGIYGESITGIPNFVLRYFGCEPRNAPLTVLEPYVKTDYKNIIVIVLDGMGSALLERHLDAGQFLRENKIADISSVMPSTTTAALTAYESGLTPLQHGWLGWSCYFKEIDACLDLFSGARSDTGEMPAGGRHLPSQLMPYKTVMETLRKQGIRTAGVSPFAEHYAKTLAHACDIAAALAEGRGRKYIYVYHEQPDTDAHLYGTDSRQIRARLQEYNKILEKFCSQTEDALILITADHGEKNGRWETLTNYPDIMECLLHPLSIEPRCVSFFVKEGMGDAFQTRFQKRFGQDFMLLTKEEALEKNLFGGGIPAAKSLEFIGDFIAVATGGVALCDNPKHTHFIALHAGFTPEEMRVPLIVIDKKKN